MNTLKFEGSLSYLLFFVIQKHGYTISGGAQRTKPNLTDSSVTESVGI